MRQLDVHRVRRLRASLLRQRHRLRERYHLLEQQMRRVRWGRATVLYERNRLRNRCDLREQPVCRVWRQWPTMLWHDLQFRIRLQQRHLRMRRQRSAVLRDGREVQRHRVSVQQQQYLCPVRRLRASMLHQRNGVRSQHDLLEQSVCRVWRKTAGLLRLRYSLQGRKHGMFRRDLCIRLWHRLRLREQLLHVERGHLRRHHQVRQLGLRIRHRGLAGVRIREPGDVELGRQSRAVD